MYVIHTPEKKRNMYSAAVTKQNNKKIRIHFDEARVVRISELPDDAGYMMHVWVPPSASGRQELEDIEKTLLEQVSLHNTEWFVNSLSEEKIKKYFRTLVSPDNVCSIVVSAIKTPTRIVWDKEEFTDFAQVLAKGSHTIQKMHCSCVVDVQGAYFYPKKFGMTLNVHSITFKTDIQEHTDDINVTVDDMCDIEASWKEECCDTCMAIDSDILFLENKIQRMIALKSELHAMLNQARTLRSSTKEWNKALEELAGMIFKYRSGQLM